MNRRFLNLVVNCSTGVHSLRRIKLANNLFYPSTSEAEAAMAQTEAAIKLNAETYAGYKHGLRTLHAMATSLGPLPPAKINFQPSGPNLRGDLSLDFVALLGDESRILCGDSCGRTSLYDADSHSVLTVPSLMSSKGRDAIPISIIRAADGYARQHDSLFVMSRSPDPEIEDYCFEELSYGGEDLFSEYQLIYQWTPLPVPPFVHHPAYKLPADIGAYTVVGGSTIYLSSMAPGVGTYSFDAVKWKWRRLGNWRLPFFGKAEYVPEHNLWFGLSASHPFHLCASDLSTLESQGSPTVKHSWVDLDMPKNWSPFQLDLINLGSGRFCVVKIFHCTTPPIVVGLPDDDEEDDDALDDCTDVIDWEFAVLTGIEVVRQDGGLRMIKHMSRFHIFEDHSINWVL
uniref:Uncharacterized protein n=1 Tax=Arundo donax TaxID=35708 RepID=A0A0A8Z202_ARUDO